VDVQISDEMLDDANNMDDQSCWPWEMVIRWSTDDDIDMNGLIYDNNVNLLGVSYFGDRIQLDGKVEVSEDVLGGADGENAEKVTGDWGTL